MLKTKKEHKSKWTQEQNSHHSSHLLQFVLPENHKKVHDQLTYPFVKRRKKGKIEKKNCRPADCEKKQNQNPSSAQSSGPT